MSESGGKRQMQGLTKLYVKVREFHNKLSNGQTMTEYALILAAIAVVVFVTYEVMGQDINTLVNGIDSDLTSAS
jgi:Flp pilus assembly pilin Flp